MEHYSDPTRQALVAELRTLPDEELKLLQRYYATRGGPGQQLVAAEAQTRNLTPLPQPDATPNRLPELHG